MPAFPRFLSLLPLFAVLAACRPAAPSLPAIQVEISHVVGAAPLVIGEPFATPAGETLSVKRLQYYLSNPRLLRADGSWQAAVPDPQLPGGYYLIDAAKPETTRFLLPPAPEGEYRGLELTIGVDEVRNGSGAQTGSLDPAHGMFWTWATGYIHFKLEGSSPASPESGQAVTLHLGGNGLQRRLFLPFAPKPLRVAAAIQPTVHLHADVAAFLGGAVPLKFAEQALVMQTKDGLPLADRLGGWLSVDHIHHEPAGAPRQP